MLVCIDRRTEEGCRTLNPDGAARCKSCHGSLAQAVSISNVGSDVGAYRLTKLIGNGAFGAVFEVQDRLNTPPQTLALKESFDGDTAGANFDEFKVLRPLSHPNLPKYVSVFRMKNHGYLAMEFIPGRSLKAELEQRTQPLAEQDVLSYAEQLCSALDFLHKRDKPVIHRDIKPDNIRLTPEGRIKLVDFGLSKQLIETHSMSRGGFTPAYAAPEQWLQHGTDPRTDVYGLSATLYHLLTKKIAPPALLRMQGMNVPPPAALRTGLSRRMNDALMKGLELDPSERWQSAGALFRAMRG